MKRGTLCTKFALAGLGALGDFRIVQKTRRLKTRNFFENDDPVSETVILDAVVIKGEDYKRLL